MGFPVAADIAVSQVRKCKKPSYHLYVADGPRRNQLNVVIMMVQSPGFEEVSTSVGGLSGVAVPKQMRKDSQSAGHNQFINIMGKQNESH